MNKYFKVLARGLAAHKGIEMTPIEMEEAIAAIVNKFRVLYPGIPEDTKEALEFLLRNTHLHF